MSWKFWRRDNALVEELRHQNEILREENKTLYERMLKMAASVPHIRIAGSEDQVEIQATSPLAIIGTEGEEEGLRIGNRGAGVV